MCSGSGLESGDGMEQGGRRKVTLRDMVVAFFILLTTGLIVGILLQGFLTGH